MEVRKNPKKPDDPGEVVRLAEERFESLIGLSSDWYWEQDDSYRFTVVMGSHLEASGVDAKRVLGTTRWDNNAVPVGDGGSWEKHKAVLKAKRPFTDFVYKRPDANGEVHYFSVSGLPIFDGKGRFCGYRGVGKDITAARRADELLGLEHSITRRLAAGEGLPETMKGVIREICESQNWEVGRYFQSDEQAGALRFVEAWSAPDPVLEEFLAASRKATFGPGVGLVGTAWQTGQPLWVPDLNKDSRAFLVKSTIRTGIRAAFLFPATAEGRTIGVMSFSSREVREPDERLLQAVRVIGSQIGQFAQRKQAEEVMRTSEGRFRSLTALSSDFYWETDAEHRLIETEYDRRSQHVIPRSIRSGKARWELPSIYPDAQGWAAHRATLEAHLPFRNFELARVDADGTERHLSISGEPVFDAGGNFTGYRGVGTDISARKRAEAVLRLEHTVARCLAEADSIASATHQIIRTVCGTLNWECGRYFTVDEPAGVLRFADAWAAPSPGMEDYIERWRDVSYAPGIGLAGLTWQSGEPQWSADLTTDPRVAQRAMAGEAGMRGSFLFPITSQGKVTGVFAFDSRVVREPDERLLIAAKVIGGQIGQFVQRKQAEKVLRESEERFRGLTQLSSDLYFTQDSEHRFTSLSGSTVTDPKRLIGKRRWDEGAANLTDADWAAHRAILESHQPFRDFEVARVNPQGKMFWVSISGAPVFDEAGHFAGYHGMVRNITERKRAEELQALEHAVTRCLTDADDVSAALKAVMRVVCETLGWDCGRYFRKDEAAGVFRFAESWYVPSAAMDKFIAYSAERTFTPGVGIVGMAGAGEPQWVADVTQDARVINKKMMAGDHGMRGAFMFPVMADGASLGVLSFTSREIREPDQRLLQAVRVIGAQIGQFLQRKRAEEVVRESEERFRHLTGLSSDMYWEQDEQFRFTSMSGSGSARVNLSTFPAVGKKRWEQNYINMTVDQWAEHIALLEAHKEFRDMELCRLSESGEKIWISISGEPVFDSFGAFKGYRGVGKDITERKQDEERIQFLANHDALTSLPNRAMFSEVLNISIQNARRYNRSFAILFIDLDRFKNINDTLGHDAGDKLLQEMGTRLTQTVRTSDVVARLGGDEFVVLVQEVAEAKQVASVARKVLSALIHPITIQGQECRVSASIGICMFPSEAQDELALMKNADIAMYRAKEDGKNTFKFYSEEMNVHSFERLALETSLRRGLERDEFILHYQAKVDLRTGKITGVEALVRWQHPEMGMVPPAQFIPLAEETGLIVPIGKWVLQTACAQNVAWQRQGLPPVHMAVNLSARQFADDDLVEDIATVLKSTGLQAELLELELTESMVIQNTERAGRVLNEIKKMGVRLAIDDFGVGYSSLTHLKRFPIDTLKVDRSFIRDLPEDLEDKAITEAIIAMGKSLNLTVVAEGVETQEQQNFLHDHSCDEMQGYFFSKPIAGDAFAELLRQRVEASKQ